VTGKGSPTVPKDFPLTGKVLPAVREGTWVTEEASSILRNVVSLGVDDLAIVRQGFRAVAPALRVGEAIDPAVVPESGPEGRLGQGGDPPE